MREKIFYGPLWCFLLVCLDVIVFPTVDADGTERAVNVRTCVPEVPNWNLNSVRLILHGILLSCSAEVAMADSFCVTIQRSTGLVILLTTSPVLPFRCIATEHSVRWGDGG
jgi:hypothetical protein